MQKIILENPEIPMTFHRLVVLLLDNSCSSNTASRNRLTMGDEIDIVIKELFSCIDSSNIKINLSFACIKFGSSPNLTLKPTEFGDIDYFNEDFNPSNNDNTNIIEALLKANKIAEDFLSNAPAADVQYSASILLLSGGFFNNVKSIVDVTNHIKQNNRITIATAYYTTSKTNSINSSSSIEILQEISSGIGCYSSIVDSQSLLKLVYIH